MKKNKKLILNKKILFLNLNLFKYKLYKIS